MTEKEKIFWHNCFNVFYGSESDKFENQCGFIECIYIRDEVIQMVQAMYDTFGECDTSDYAKFLVIQFQRTIGCVNWNENTLNKTLELAYNFFELYKTICIKE